MHLAKELTLSNDGLRALQKLYDDCPSAFEEFVRSVVDPRFRFGALTLIIKDGKFQHLRKESTYV